MSIPTTACCTVLLQQQQEQAIHYYDRCRQNKVKPCQDAHKFCTVVENGRVVVKPIEPLQ